MSFSSPVILNFDGKNYEIAPDQILFLIAKIEDVITLSQLLDAQRPSPAKLSMAYGLALRHAGAKVTDGEIYQSIFKEGSAQKIGEAVTGLMALMIPPDDIQEKVFSSKKPRPVKAKNKR
jgi:hypothetical protein